MVHPFISIRLSCRSFPFLLRSAPKPVAVAAGKGGIGIAWDSIVSPGRLSAFPTVIVTGHHILPVSRCRCQRRHRYSARSGLLRIVAVVAVIGGRGIRLDRALLCISRRRCHRRHRHSADFIMCRLPYWSVPLSKAALAFGRLIACLAQSFLCKSRLWRWRRCCKFVASPLCFILERCGVLLGQLIWGML